MDITIKDGRKLKPLAKKYGFEYDKKYKYITKDPLLEEERKLRKDGYILKYQSGCFYPYLNKIKQ